MRGGEEGFIRARGSCSGIRCNNRVSAEPAREAELIRFFLFPAVPFVLHAVRTTLSQPDTLDKLVIRGGTPLTGQIVVGGSKNTALPLMTAAVLAPGTTTLTNIPALRDVYTYSNVLRVSGAHVAFDEAANTVTIDAARVEYPEAPYELVKKMRASFYMLGALLGRCGQARVSMPGGCAWGPRPVDLHIEGMKAFGAEVSLDEGYVVATAPGGRLPGGTFRLEPSSVGATVNLLLAAVTARGGSRIENAAMEPDVVVFGEALQAMGATISGLGTSTIEIEGVDELRPVTFANTPDRIELGTFMITAAMAGTPGTPITMTNADARHLGSAFIEAFEETGVPFELHDDRVVVTPNGEVKPVSIETDIYPGFPTDLQAQWTVMMVGASGPSVVRDNIYLDRFAHVPELLRMGIDARLKGNAVHIAGNQTFQSATVMSTDLRGSVALVMAGLVAKGETHVLRIYHLDRGYEDLEGRLRGLGANVRREQYEEFPTVTEAA